MWVIFLLSALLIALTSLLIIWIGNRVYLSIKRQNKRFEMEDEVYEGTKKQIKKQFKKKENNNEG